MGWNVSNAAGFTPGAAGDEIAGQEEGKLILYREVQSEFQSWSGESCYEGESHPMEPFAFHHFGVAVKDLRKSISLYKSLMNYRLISGPFDDPIQKVSVCFLSRGDGDPLMELVAPLGADSPIDGILKKGGGVYHVCYEVVDLSAAIQHLTEQGSLLLSGPVPAVAFEMREIAWVMTETNLLVEIVQAKEES